MKELITSPRPDDNPRPPELGCLTVILSALVTAVIVVLLLLLLTIGTAGCCPCKHIITTEPQEAAPGDTCQNETWWF